MVNDLDEFTAYLTQLNAEHRQLQECLRDIDGLWVDHEVSPLAEVIPQVTDALKTLRAELTHHFDEEESGGCLEEAVSRQPSLSHEAMRLEDEHPILLEHLDRLLVKLKAMAQSIPSAAEAKEEFRCFAEQLHAHEAAENRILEESFGIDLD